LVEACTNVLARGCQAGVDGGALSPCTVCLGISNFQVGEITSSYRDNFCRPDGGTCPTEADVAALLAECIRNAGDCTAVGECMRGTFLP
jgi:hypothetical protein